MRKTERIEFIKKELLPLLSYVNLNNLEEEKYEWTCGDKYYTVRKNIFKDTDFVWEVYLSIYRISNNRHFKVASAFVYKDNYNVGDLCDEFFMHGKYSVQPV